jgi:hypothetical protein
MRRYNEPDRVYSDNEFNPARLYARIEAHRQKMMARLAAGPEPHPEPSPVPGPCPFPVVAASLSASWSDNNTDAPPMHATGAKRSQSGASH